MLIYFLKKPFKVGDLDFYICLLYLPLYGQRRVSMTPQRYEWLLSKYLDTYSEAFFFLFSFMSFI